MRAIIQRVSEAFVIIKEQKVADIQQGLLVLLGIEIKDTKEDALWLAIKFQPLEFLQISKA